MSEGCKQTIVDTLLQRVAALSDQQSLLDVVDWSDTFDWRTARPLGHSNAPRKEPPWPDWLDVLLTPEGWTALRRAYAHCKASRLAYRSRKIDCQDFAVAFVSAAAVMHRYDMLTDAVPEVTDA